MQYLELIRAQYNFLLNTQLWLVCCCKAIEVILSSCLFVALYTFKGLSFRLPRLSGACAGCSLSSTCSVEGKRGRGPIMHNLTHHCIYLPHVKLYMWWKESAQLLMANMRLAYHPLLVSHVWNQAVLSSKLQGAHCMLAVRSCSPSLLPLIPPSSTAFWKYWPSWDTIIRVCSSSLKAQIFLLDEGTLYFFRARSPRDLLSKSLEKKLQHKKIHDR